MILEGKSEEFKQFFLLTLTRELIKSTLGDSIKELKLEENIEKEIIKKKTKEIIKEQKQPLKLSPVKQLQAITQQQFKPLPKPFTVKRTAPRKLMIPQTRFPQRLQYIKPTPTEVQIELGKLDDLIKDPGVQIIECNGPDEPILIKTPAEKKTNVVLTKEEIDEVIQRFSEISRIPVNEGIFRVAVGKLLLSAIISKVVGTKFIIKKLRAMPQLIPRGRLR